MAKLVPIDFGRGNLQSEGERFLSGQAWTIGRDETLSERQVVIQSMFDPVPGVTWSPESWLDQAMLELSAVGALPPGWDSYGASAISPSAISVAEQLLKLLADHNAPRPALVPTSDGGIQIEWYGADVEIQLEIDPDPNEVYLFYRNVETGMSWHGKPGDEPEPLNKLLWQISFHG